MSTKTDYDGTWKRAITLHFPQFLEFFFPDIHAQIDWNKGYQLMESALHKVARNARVGGHHADMLLSVTALDGRETWVIVHIEVQSQHDESFPERMYVYHYRTFDRYRRDVVSLAILGDRVSDWHPKSYQRSLWGCQSALSFPAVKLLDLGEAVTHPSNPFSWLVSAHLKAQRSRPSSRRRLDFKLELIQGLHSCGLDEGEIADFFDLVDWIMVLSKELTREFHNRIAHLEEDNQVKRYATSIEKLLREEVTESVTREVTESVTRGVTESVTREVTESVTREVTESVTREVTESVTRELEERVTREVTESVTRELEERVTREVREAGIVEGRLAVRREDILQVVLDRWRQPGQELVDRLQGLSDESQLTALLDWARQAGSQAEFLQGLG